MNKNQDPQTPEHEDDEDFEAESEGSDGDAADFDFGPTQQGNYEFGDLNYWANSPFPWYDRFITISKEHFGLDSFLPYQKASMNATLSKRDVFLIIPNDSNKSLTYQLPSLLGEGATIVFIPLVETMQCEVTQITKKNISALNLSGTEGANVNLTSVLSEYNEKQKESVSKDAKKYPRIIFLSPEQLTSSETIPSFLKDLYQRGLIQRFVVDEAHCISSLSHEFRKEYLNLNKLKADFPGIPILAMTASEDFRNDIIQQLGMKDVLSFQHSFNRTNLVFEVRAKDKRTCTDQIAQFIQAEYPGKTGIIYTTSIKDAVKVSDELKSKFGIKSAFYHSQMLKEPRINAENAWVKGDIDVIVATASFGVSRNKPNVRFIIHYNPTRSLKHYYQQISLVGKDGLKSHCIIYYHPKEKRAVEFFIGKSGDSQQVKRQYVVELFLLLKYCEDQYTCRRALLFSYFGEHFDREKCNGMCDNCQTKKRSTMKDMTGTVQKIVGFFNQHHGEDFPLDRLPRMLIGSGRKYKDFKVIDEKLNRDEVMAILKEMIVAKYLVIDFKVVKKRKNDSLESIARLDKSKASILLEGKDQLTMQYPFYAIEK